MGLRQHRNVITQSLLYEPEGSENPKSATVTLRLRDGPPYASIALLSLKKVLLSSEKNWDNVMLNFQQPLIETTVKQDHPVIVIRTGVV